MANISHELRSPLTRIRVALELLPRNGATQARLADVEADLDELERLIEDVLTASRLEATGLPPHPELVEAQRLLEDLAGIRLTVKRVERAAEVEVDGNVSLALVLALRRIFIAFLAVVGARWRRGR